MRQVLPFVRDGVDETRVVLDEGRTPVNKPWWLYSNMVASVDGGTAVSGRSGPLGGGGDLAVFRALRSTADVIVVGAGTVRAEQYRLPRAATGAAADHRTEHGLAPRPVLCIVSRSMGLDPTTPVFDELRNERTDATVVIATALTAPDPPGQIAEHAEVIRLGADDVDLGRLVTVLAERGLRRILCEGGPSLLGQFAALDLVDEWNLTTSPLIVTGDSSRITRSPGSSEARLRLARLMIDDDSTMFARYLRVTSERSGDHQLVAGLQHP